MPEAPLGDFAAQVAVGGGDHAHVHRQLAGGADRPDAAFFEGPQQLGLQHQRQLADFVEKEGAAVGVEEQALVVLAGTGEGALGVAEEFAFDQLGRDGGAVDRHEGALGAQAHLVQGAGRDFLADAGFAEDQHRGRQRGDAADQCAEVLDGGGAPDQPVHAAGQVGHLAAQHVVFGGQAGALEAALQGVEELVEAEGLEDEIRGAGAQGVDGGFHVGEGGDEDHLAGKAAVAQFVEPGQPGLSGQGDVEDDEVEMAHGEVGRAFLGRAGDGHGAAPVDQRPLEKAAHAGFVIHHQYGVVGPGGLGGVGGGCGACGCGVAHGGGAFVVCQRWIGGGLNHGCPGLPSGSAASASATGGVVLSVVIAVALAGGAASSVSAGSVA